MESTMNLACPNIYLSGDEFSEIDLKREEIQGIVSIQKDCQIDPGGREHLGKLYLKRKECFLFLFSD
jgi:hypothetical protein